MLAAERETFSPAAKGDRRPYELDDTEGPRARQESVGTRQGATEREGEDEAGAAILQGVYRHHEGEGLADDVEAVTSLVLAG